MDEACHQGDDLMAGQARQTDNLIQRERSLYDVEQAADVVVVGDHRTLRLL